MHDVAWRCDMNCVRSKDAHKQLARTSLKKSEQAEIVAFNRLVANYNIHFFNFIGAETRELVLTVVTQDRKVWNERTNDFSES